MALETVERKIKAFVVTPENFEEIIEEIENCLGCDMVVTLNREDGSITHVQYDIVKDGERKIIQEDTYLVLKDGVCMELPNFMEITDPME